MVNKCSSLPFRVRGSLKFRKFVKEWFGSVLKRLPTAKTWKNQGSEKGPVLGPVLEPVLAGFSAKNDVLTEAPRATWHYYSSVFGVCRCLGRISHGNRFGTHFGPHFGAHLGSQIRLFFYRSRPRPIPVRPQKAWAAIGRGSKIGSKNGSEKNRSEVENGPAGDPKGRRPETTGRN